MQLYHKAELKELVLWLLHLSEVQQSSMMKQVVVDLLTFSFVVFALKIIYLLIESFVVET